MRYIYVKKTERGTYSEATDDGMYGLLTTLEGSAALSLHCNQEFLDQYHGDKIDWLFNSFGIKSVGKNRLQVYDVYDRPELLTTVVPRDALWEFIPVYWAACNENWQTMTIGFDEKQFKIWLDDKEYIPDPNKLRSIDASYQNRMKYITITKKCVNGIDGKSYEATHDEMCGLLMLLESSHMLFQKYSDCLQRQIETGTIDWRNDSIHVKNYCRDLIGIIPTAPTCYGQKNDGKKFYALHIKEPLLKFISVYQAAEKKNWQTMKIGHGRGREFRIWLDGEEYNPTSSELESVIALI